MISTIGAEQVQVNAEIHTLWEVLAGRPRDLIRTQIVRDGTYDASHDSIR
jgi:hypothetical protein